MPDRAEWERAMRLVYARFGKLQLTDRAAALAFYGFLSLLPSLIVAVALLGVLGSYPETYESIIETLREAAPGTAIDTIDSALRDVLRGQDAGGLLGLGLIFALVTGSGAVGAAIRALETINETRASGSFVRTLLTRLWLTLALMALFLVAFASLVVAGPIFGSIAEEAGLGDAGRTAVALGRYPLGMAALLAATLMLYSLGPAARHQRQIRDHVPGALLAGALWVLASLGFSFYVANFGSYNATYGALGAVIVLLLWIYIVSLAMLVGALVNRELRRVRKKR